MHEKVEVGRQEAGDRKEGGAQALSAEKEPGVRHGPPAATAAEKVDEIGSAAHGLKFAIDKSIRYHQRRRAHYDRIHRMLMFLIILSGSAAFASVTVPFVPSQWFGAVAAVIAALDLVWGFSHRARDHEILVRDFTELAATVNATEISVPALAAWTNRRLEIEAKEPPTFWAVEADCYNEAARALDADREFLVSIPWMHRRLMNWWRFERHSYDRPRGQPITGG
jgi:hypothetical protein